MGITPLHSAAAGGHTTVVLALVEWGGNIDALDSEDCTPLHHACFYDRIECALALINAGANVKMKNIYEKSSIDFIKDGSTREQILCHVNSLELSATNAHVVKDERAEGRTLLATSPDRPEINNESVSAPDPTPVPTPDSAADRAPIFPKHTTNNVIRVDSEGSGQTLWGELIILASALLVVLILLALVSSGEL